MVTESTFDVEAERARLRTWLADATVTGEKASTAVRQWFDAHDQGGHYTHEERREMAMVGCGADSAGKERARAQKAVDDLEREIALRVYAALLVDAAKARGGAE